MKAQEVRLSKLEFTVENSADGLARKAIRLLCKDSKFEAAYTRELLSNPIYESKNNEILIHALKQDGEPITVQPEDEEILSAGLASLPMKLRRKMQEAGFDI